MSVDYDLVCHECKERVALCSDGFSGPLTQCDRSMAAFAITHRQCSLDIIDENCDDFDDYKDWDITNWKELLSYETKD